MTTPVQRISRLLDEEARFVAYLPGNIVIDVTPDVTAALAESKSRELCLKSSGNGEESSADASQRSDPH
jgi:hypothetical protein